jgi:tetratricopeptide (TPR) repeat protein
MRFFRSIICAAFLSVATSSLAAAQVSRDLQTCATDGPPADTRIAACTRAINARGTDQARALAYASRGGLTAIHKRDFARAIADLDQAIRLQPRIALFHHLRGGILQEDKQVDAAIASFDAAVRLDPKLSGVHRFRGLAHLRKGNLPQAMSDLNEALKIDVQAEAQAEALAYRAEVYVKTGDRERGLQDYARSIELNAKVDQRYVERAAIHFDMGRFDQALADLDRVIAQIPTNATARYGRGKILRLRGENERALRDLDEAIRLDPKYVLALVERGMARVAMGRIEPALADAREAIGLNQPARGTPVSDYEAALALGGALSEQRRYGDCVTVMTRAINTVAEPRKEHWQTFNVRGVCAHQLRRFEDAESDYRKALSLDGDQPEAMNNLAYVMVERGGNLEEALSLSVRANALGPDNAGYVDTLGAIYLKLGRLAQATEMLEKADKLSGTGFPTIKMNLGDAYWRGGRRGDAVARWSQALALKPDDAVKADLESRLRNGLPEPAGQFALAAAPAAGPVAAVAPSAAAAALAAVAPAAADPGRRVALVIGNSEYRAVSALPNPRRDAAALADTLRRLGFATVRLEGDLPREKLVEALRSFAREAASADWAIIYFAGHGLEINGTNYLVPVDARLETDRDVQYEALPLDQVTGAVEGARKLRLVILDACRDNPFVRGMRRTAATRSIGRGLGRIEPEGGTMVAYAAKNGEVALDGEGANSPFVTALLKHLPTPGLEIGMMFRHVRDDVMAATGRKQEPFVYGSLPAGGFYFVAQK